jgi:hypothetical protein
MEPEELNNPSITSLTAYRVSATLAVALWRESVLGSAFGLCCLVSAAETIPLTESPIVV